MRRPGYPLVVVTLMAPGLLLASVGIFSVVAISVTRRVLRAE